MSKTKEHTRAKDSEGEEVGSSSGHPERLLLVSEPKIQCHREEALGARSPPSHPEMQVPSLGAYW